MSRYQPPFTITSAILNLVVETGELLGHWAAYTGRASPLLRKENRIRTIQASLAIEHNSLTIGGMSGSTVAINWCIWHHLRLRYFVLWMNCLAG